MALSIEEMAVFCKAKGFVFPNSDIYGGLGGFFDYGPMGSELKNNIKQTWWKRFVQERDDVVGIDGTIITHPKVWQASGHVDCFADVMIECKKCHKRFRADHLIAEKLDMKTEGMTKEYMTQLIEEKNVKCPECESELSKAENFNLMFTTNIGPVQSEESKAYLRPETAQLIFADYKAVMDTSRMKFPFGIAQMGKAFRNEISPRDFLFRTREFEQMEIEFFIHPKEQRCSLLTKEDLEFEFQLLGAKEQENDKEHYSIKAKEMIDKKICGEWHVYWLKEVYQWFIHIGIKKENLRLREHMKDELAHYSSACFDVEYKFPFGWQEIHGNANRGQFDLMQHEKVSKRSMGVFDEATKEKVVARVIEPSQGTDRAFLAVMFDAYSTRKDEKGKDVVVLNLDPMLSPVKVGIFPLVNKVKDEGRKVYDMLRKQIVCQFDSSGSIGRRYARADELGVPYCITIDFDTLEDKSVTIRKRENAEQKRVKIDELKDVLEKLIKKELKFEEL